MPFYESKEESSSEPKKDIAAADDLASRAAKAGRWCAMISCLSIVSLMMTIPFSSSQRDKHGCDALCVGSMTSVRSALGLVGGILVGRLSDSVGRRAALVLGLLAGIGGTLAFGLVDSLNGLWLSMLPSALLSHQFLVLKALASDWAQAAGSSAAQRGAVMGQLGTAVGVGFMVGPAAGGFLVSDFRTCAFVSCGLQVLVAVLALHTFPTPPASAAAAALDPTSSFAAVPVEAAAAATVAAAAAAAAKPGVAVAAGGDDKWAMEPFTAPPAAGAVAAAVVPASKSFFAFLSSGVCRTRGALFLLWLRFGLALAYHVFNTAFQASLRTRFDFTPKLYSTYLMFAGATYALSQAAASKPLMARFEANHAPLLCGCLAALAGGRAVAATALTLPGMFAGTFVVIMSLGVINTVLSAAVSTISPSDETGGLFGVMEAVESVTGIVGPTLGGLVVAWGAARGYEQPALLAVLAAYGLLAVAVASHYDATVMHQARTLAFANLKAASGESVRDEAGDKIKAE